MEENHQLNIRIEISTPQEEKCLPAVDMICWAIFRFKEYSDDTYIERFNRTIQEEFIDQHEELLFNDLEAFNHALMDYLLFYNTKRIHYSLGNQTPIDFIIQKSNMSRTDTRP